jgi:hypothetical protein
VKLQSRSPDEFETELDCRIDRLQAAADALRASFGPALQGASLPRLNMAEDQRLWQEVEAAEQDLELAWAELGRRRDARLGRPDSSR